ncbi:MAG: hypothetical protein IPK18_07840 [Sphingobacteriales bacterium]|nr:MAG: hypothetical protein IPK18_07840 [Sphingobacteriales bacterium]
MKIHILNMILMIFLIVSCKKEENNATSKKLVESYNVTMGNQTTPTSGWNCFFSFDSAKVYRLSEAFNNQSKIDLIFLHNDPDDVAMFVSPFSMADAIANKPYMYATSNYGVEDWTTKNTLQINVTDITVSDFNNITTVEQLNTAYENDKNITNAWEVDISANKVYRFMTNSNRIGLIKVNSISGNHNTKGEINFDVKIIK